VIALLGRLNADGTTIVVVTHDEDLARAARRVVHMRDGVIVRDEMQDVSGDRDGGAERAT
jgi:putative ABC transport system ATP-binding protein